MNNNDIVTGVVIKDNHHYAILLPCGRILRAAGDKLDRDDLGKKLTGKYWKLSSYEVVYDY